jgi:chorismate dehydratase
MKYRVAAVNYVNTLPFIHGLRSAQIADKLEVILAHPARCAELLQKGEVDIALCPVGALAGMQSYEVISDYCIGCDGAVRTVSVYSDQPLEQITRIVLSSESRTSNLLVQLLNKSYWKLPIEFVTTDSDPSSSPGFLFIGDVCFQKETEYRYRTDLGQAWKDWTGLPFAFAVWVSRAGIEHTFETSLNAAFADGIARIDDLEFPAHSDSQVLKEYLKRNISFVFDDPKKRAMQMFLQML